MRLLVVPFSSDYMQEFWAKILAGELNAPNTYAYKTMEILRTFSQKEALLLETFSTKVLHTANHHFIPHSKSYFENLRIEYMDILQLTDYGIISALADSSLNLDVECNYSILCQNNQKCLSIKSTTDTSTTLYLPIYLLSKFGAELISIINQGSSNEALNYFAMEIKTTNPDIETDVRNLVEISIEPINN